MHTTTVAMGNPPDPGAGGDVIAMAAIPTAVVLIPGLVPRQSDQGGRILRRYFPWVRARSTQLNPTARWCSTSKSAGKPASDRGKQRGKWARVGPTSGRSFPPATA